MRVARTARRCIYSGVDESRRGILITISVDHDTKDLDRSEDIVQLAIARYALP